MLDSLASTFKALGDPTRLSMLGLLRIRDLCVCEFVTLLGLSQPAVSQHLRRLKETGLVTCHRRGTWVIYHLTGDLPLFVAAVLDALPRFPEWEEYLRMVDPETACRRFPEEQGRRTTGMIAAGTT